MAVLISYARGCCLYRFVLFFFVFVLMNFFLLNIMISVPANNEGRAHQLGNKTTYLELYAVERLSEGGSPQNEKPLLNLLKKVDNLSLVDENVPKVWIRLSSSLLKSFFTLMKETKPQCPAISNKLVGWTNISAENIIKEKRDVVEYKMIQSGVTAGGRYEPSECQARNKIAIVVPVRNRREHLTIFLRYMHPFLQRQQLDYAIIVVEQSRGSPFNRGMLMNIGFREALLQDQEFQCFFFHDVDMLPENDGNPYTCPEDGRPRLMTFSLDNWDNYKPTPNWYFGGVTALSTGDFRKINGFSNVFWGWGGEDNDLLQRIKMKNMTTTRTLEEYPSLVHMARYKTLYHRKAEPSIHRIRLLEEGPKRIATDGLTDLKYERVDIQLKLLFTHIFVDIQQPPNINSTSD